MDARETARLWRVHKTINQMIHDRGYIVGQSHLDMSLSDFIQMYSTGSGLVEYVPLFLFLQFRARAVNVVLFLQIHAILYTINLFSCILIIYF